MPTAFDGVEAEDLALAPPILELVDGPLPQPKVGQECNVCEWSPDQTLFAWSCGKVVKIVSWNRLVSGSETAESLLGSALTINVGQYVLSAAFSKRPSPMEANVPSAAAAADGGGGVRRRDCNNNSRYHFHRLDELVLALGLQNGRIRAYGAASGKLLLELMDHTDAVRGLKFAPDGSMVLASASRDGRLKFWNLNDDGNMFMTIDTMLAGNRHPLYACAWSPCGKLLASAGAFKHVVVWDMQKCRPMRRLVGHHHDVLACQFSADGLLLATSSCDTTAIIWDHLRGEKICVLGHLFPVPSPIYAGGANDAYVRSVAISPDNLSAVSVADDRYVRFWDLTAWRLPAAVGRLSSGTPLCCSYSPAGDAVAVGNSNGDVTFFLSTPAQPTLSQLCRRVIRQSLQGGCRDPTSTTLAFDKLNFPYRLKNYLKFVHV